MFDYLRSGNVSAPGPVEPCHADARPAPALSPEAAAALERELRLCDNRSSEVEPRAMQQGPDQTIEMTYADLVARTAGGDAGALAALYDATAGQIYAFALRIAGERAAAEEIVSDVYFQVWNQAGRYDPARGRVLAWMMMMCRSRALDTLRRRDPALSHPDPTLLCPDAASLEGDALDILLALERDSAVALAVSKLAARERKLLALSFYRDLSHQEIADETGLPLGTVKTVLRRAMQALRPALTGVSFVAKENS